MTWQLLYLKTIATNKKIQLQRLAVRQREMKTTSTIAPVCQFG